MKIIQIWAVDTKDEQGFKINSSYFKDEKRAQLFVKTCYDSLELVDALVVDDAIIYLLGKKIDLDGVKQEEIDKNYNSALKKLTPAELRALKMKFNS